MRCKHRAQSGIENRDAFNHESLDGIMSCGVIEHDERGPTPALAEMWQILKPGGRLFVTVTPDRPAMARTSVTEFGAPEQHRSFQSRFEVHELPGELGPSGFRSTKTTSATHHFARCPPGSGRVESLSSLVKESSRVAMRPYINGGAGSVNMILRIGSNPRVAPDAAGAAADPSSFTKS